MTRVLPSSALTVPVNFFSLLLFSSVTPAVRVQNAVVQNRFKCCIRYNGSKTIWLSMGLVTIFGFLFNISRWFEIRVVPKTVSFF